MARGKGKIKKMTKRELNTLDKAIQILEEFYFSDDDGRSNLVYDLATAEGVQPSTAMGVLNDIIIHEEKRK